MPPCDTGGAGNRLTCRASPRRVSEGFWRIMWSSEILAWLARPHCATSRVSINVPVPTHREGLWHKEKGALHGAVTRSA
jgi:hypothetical protein